MKGLKDDELARKDKGGKASSRAITWAELQSDLQMSINHRVRELSRVDGAPDLIDKFKQNRPRTAPSKNLHMAALEESFDKAVKIKDAFDFSHLGVDTGPTAEMLKRKREDISPNMRPKNSLMDVEVNPIE